MKTIKTKLKFIKSNRSESWVGFISKNTKNGRIKGVREDSELPKKVCIASYALAPMIEPDVLYDVKMVPSHKFDGYMVIEAEPCAFDARIESTVLKSAIYMVEVKFGNKTIVFDPKDGRNDNYRTVEGVVAILEKRKDIKNLFQVIADFRRTANIVLTMFKNDGYYVEEKIKKVS